ncbi:hypothetical protein [Methanobrevibacter sp.]|uniref:hypothetical protein n=1 Tax=Methanobrevibacter sp. TaxID=66852 RepID=UPI00388D4C47
MKNDSFDIPVIEEITLRDIPYAQQKEEIIEYCRKKKRVFLSEIAYDLKLDLGDVYNIINELIEEGILGVRDDSY